MDSLLVGHLKKQERITVADQIYLDIRKLLMSGTLPPGEKVTLRALAKALNTSPMPVREAVNKLVTEGALEMQPNRTIRVPKPTLKKFKEIVRIRCCLEGFAAEEACKIISKEAIEEIEFYSDTFDRLGHEKIIDTEKTIEANRNLHFCLYKAADMPILLGMIENIWLQISPLFSLSMSSELRQSQTWESFNHHANLLNALKGKKPKEAKKAIISDILDAALFIEKSCTL